MYWSYFGNVSGIYIIADVQQALGNHPMGYEIGVKSLGHSKPRMRMVGKLGRIYIYNKSKTHFDVLNWGHYRYSAYMFPKSRIPAGFARTV